MAAPTFADLCAAMAAAGADALVALEDGRHAIRLVDRPGGRALDSPSPAGSTAREVLNRAPPVG